MSTQENNAESQNTALRRWGDEQQYDAAPMQADYDERTGVMPKVHLVWMTPDPLGAIASACRMYEGKPTYSLDDITNDERLHYWRQAQATHLKAPLEFVNFHFFLEGVDRSFTHQMVRQRTAVYAQESQRFAVMGGNFRENTSLPPSLHGTVKAEHENADWAGRPQQWRSTWDDALMHIEEAYTRLVEGGMPAEEARGLLPNAMATRLNYHTNLRSLMDHAGNRLCTQAQFHWRIVFAEIAQAIGGYRSSRPVHDDACDSRRGLPCDCAFTTGDAWQFHEISKAFRPVCYEMGKCPFNATFDRDCSIKSRVEAFAAEGVPSSQWHEGTDLIPGIDPREWMTDPAAARRA